MIGEEILVIVRGGVVQHISKINTEVPVFVIDYDDLHDMLGHPEHTELIHEHVCRLLLHKKEDAAKELLKTHMELMKERKSAGA
jgi:hypothetical protein